MRGLECMSLFLLVKVYSASQTWDLDNDALARCAVCVCGGLATLVRISQIEGLTTATPRFSGIANSQVSGSTPCFLRGSLQTVYRYGDGSARREFGVFAAFGPIPWCCSEGNIDQGVLHCSFTYRGDPVALIWAVWLTYGRGGVGRGGKWPVFSITWEMGRRRRSRGLKC